MKHDRNVTTMIVGLVVVLVVSFFQGFASTFDEMLRHVARDLTAELAIHVYIAGWLLFLYGLYRYAKKRWF